MDAFKILARSTKIRKGAPQTKNTPGQQIPSGGLSRQDRIDLSKPIQTLVREKLTSRGVKRKRGEVDKSQNHLVRKNLLLDGNGDEDVQSSAASSEGFNQAVYESIDDSKEVVPSLNEEDCRRTLKLHKLKITILQNASSSRNGYTGARDVAAKPNTKNTYTQVYSQPLTTFKSLHSKYRVSRRLVENIGAQGYREPTEVQIGSLPLLLGSLEDLGLVRKATKESREHPLPEIDLLTVAPTGSGKTLCFMVHLLHGLLKERKAVSRTTSQRSGGHQVQAVIIAPTHELADQIANEGKKLAFGTGISVSALRKGARIQSEPVDTPDEPNGPLADTFDGTSKAEGLPISNSVVKADVLISTPLTLLHSISVKDSARRQLSNIRFLVLDEADVLLDPLFREQTLSIWKACTHHRLQTSLWSATMGSSIESLAQSFIEDRRRKLHSTSKHHYLFRLVVGLKDSAIPNVSHRLVYAASEQGKLLALRQLLHPSTTSLEDILPLQPPFLIFTQNVSRAIALHSELLYDIAPEGGGSSRVAVLHSELSDAARSKVMAGFRKGDIWILITTDLLSRGVDFQGINGVVNYDIPNSGAAYVHRAGRTGRQGREGGVAVTLYTKDDIPYVKNIANVIAASEHANGTTTGAGSEDKAMQKWLLDALPNVSKKTRKELKRKGVEGRRVNVGDRSGKVARKTRISTKSGYDRQLENRRLGAVLGIQRREAQSGLGEVSSDDDDDGEWQGFNS